MFKRIIHKLHFALSYLMGKYYFDNFGKRSVLCSPKRIINGKYVRVGKDVFINYGLRLECLDTFDSRHFTPEVLIGNNVNIEQNVQITCADSIYIGDECSILGNVLITDITHPYFDINTAPKYQMIKASPVIIEKQTMIGMGAKILPGVKIGVHCVIGANSVVTKDIPDYSIVAGVPAEIIKKYNLKKNKWELIK